MLPVTMKIWLAATLKWSDQAEWNEESSGSVCGPVLAYAASLMLWAAPSPPFCPLSAWREVGDRSRRVSDPSRIWPPVIALLARSAPVSEPSLTCEPLTSVIDAAVAVPASEKSRASVAATFAYRVERNPGKTKPSFKWFASGAALLTPPWGHSSSLSQGSLIRLASCWTAGTPGRRSVPALTADPRRPRCLQAVRTRTMTCDATFRSSGGRDHGAARPPGPARSPRACPSPARQAVTLRQ